MDVLRKELNNIYAGQHLERETLPSEDIEHAIKRIDTMVSVNHACAVITDISCNRSFLFPASLDTLLGLPLQYTNDIGHNYGNKNSTETCLQLSSSDEDMIYCRMHPVDLVDKRMLEYEFFRFTERLAEKEKLAYKAVCHIRLRNAHGEYVCVDNSTQLLRLSPAGKMWLILCCYEFSAIQDGPLGIDGKILCNATGETIPFTPRERNAILTTREKEILCMIRQGHLSKEIAVTLGISINTVNRHRQNILEKLCVDNSIEAVNAAISMGLI